MKPKESKIISFTNTISKDEFKLYNKDYDTSTQKATLFLGEVYALWFVDFVKGKTQEDSIYIYPEFNQYPDYMGGGICD